MLVLGLVLVLVLVLLLSVSSVSVSVSLPPLSLSVSLSLVTHWYPQMVQAPQRPAPGALQPSARRPAGVPLLPAPVGGEGRQAAPHSEPGPVPGPEQGPRTGLAPPPAPAPAPAVVSSTTRTPPPCPPFPAVAHRSTVDMEPDCEFYGLRVPAGKAVATGPAAGGQGEDTLQAVHLTQVALGAAAAPGRHTIFASTGGAKFAVGTLVQGQCEQFAVDYMATDSIEFSHTGASDVFLTGYKTTSSLMDSFPDDSDQDLDEDEEDEEDEFDDDDEPPAGVQLPQEKTKMNGQVRFILYGHSRNA